MSPSNSIARAPIEFGAIQAPSSPRYLVSQLLKDIRHLTTVTRFATREYCLIAWPNPTMSSGPEVAGNQKVALTVSNPLYPQSRYPNRIIYLRYYFFMDWRGRWKSSRVCRPHSPSPSGLVHLVSRYPSDKPPSSGLECSWLFFLSILYPFNYHWFRRHLPLKKGDVPQPSALGIPHLGSYCFLLNGLRVPSIHAKWEKIYSWKDLLVVPNICLFDLGLHPCMGGGILCPSILLHFRRRRCGVFHPRNCQKPCFGEC